MEALQVEDTEHTCQQSGFFSHWEGPVAAAAQGVRTLCATGERGKVPRLGLSGRTGDPFCDA